MRLIALFLFLCSTLTASAQHNFHNSYYDAKRALHESIPAVQGAIVMLGNSLTERGSWAEYFPGTDVLNRGIGGDIFAGMIDRVVDIMRNKPTKVFIMAGANDILFHNISAADFEKKYLTLIAKVTEQAPNCKIYLSSILPVNEKVKPENTFLAEKNGTIIAMNALVKTIAKKTGATFIDIHSHMLEDGLLKPSFTEDGVHVNEKGYLIWSRQLKNFIYE